jgi:hypothetical protein
MVVGLEEDMVEGEIVVKVDNVGNIDKVETAT